MLNNLRLSLSPLWLQLQAQLQGNQRLRWMLWGIGYILVLYLGLTLSEWRTAQSENLALIERRSLKLDQLQHQTQWAQRWEQEKAVSADFRAKLWQAQSESLAEADVQNYLRKLMSEHNMQNYRPRLAPTQRVDIAGESLIKVSAEVNGTLAVEQIDHLLKTMADNAKLVQIERFSYAPQRGGQLDLQLSAYFLQVTDSAAQTLAPAEAPAASAANTSTPRIEPAPAPQEPPVANSKHKRAANHVAP